jgi:hypothetical protein
MTLDWIMGFIEGEGSFNIMRNRGVFRCTFQLVQRDDNAAVLSAVRKIIGGNVYAVRKGYGGSNPQVALQIETKSACLGLVDLLSCTKMHTKKRMDFVIWAEAVKAWQVQDWGKMERLSGAIKAVRKYKVMVDPKYLRAA